MVIGRNFRVSYRFNYRFHYYRCSFPLHRLPGIEWYKRFTDTTSACSICEKQYQNSGTPAIRRNKIRYAFIRIWLIPSVQFPIRRRGQNVRQSIPGHFMSLRSFAFLWDRWSPWNGFTRRYIVQLLRVVGKIADGQ